MNSWTKWGHISGKSHRRGHWPAQITPTLTLLSTVEGEPLLVIHCAAEAGKPLTHLLLCCCSSTHILRYFASFNQVRARNFDSQAHWKSHIGQQPGKWVYNCLHYTCWHGFHSRFRDLGQYSESVKVFQCCLVIQIRCLVLNLVEPKAFSCGVCKLSLSTSLGLIDVLLVCVSACKGLVTCI